MKLRNLFVRRSAVERDMADEMEFHREARARDLERQGMPPGEAARAARLEFGSTEAYREECRAALGYRMWDELAADVRYAFRAIRHQPGFHAAAVLILTLAIGVNTAFFTLYSNYFLKPLAVRGADRLYTLAAHDARGGSARGFTAAEVDTLRQSARNEMEGIFTAHSITALVHAPVHRQTLVAPVSPNYFSLLGGVPQLGRTFAANEASEPVAVLSQQGARRIFPETPNPLGRTLRIRSTAFTVIGVMPAAFTGVEPAIADLWIGDRMRHSLHGPDGSEHPARVSGLLAPDVSKERAEAALTAGATRFNRPREQPVSRIELMRQTSMFSGDNATTPVVVLLFAAFWTVLLIACANLANLYLARAASRTHEIAMRLSLGASRPRIIRQLLTESTVTALLGAAGGCALAVAAAQSGLDWAASILGAHGITLPPIAHDWRVFFYAAMLGGSAGILFGLMPAIEFTTPSLTQSGKRDASPLGGRIRPRRLRNLLTGGQVAASLVLLLIGAVLVRTIGRIGSADLGYDAARIFDLRLDNPDPALLREIERLPGVSAVAAVECVPLYGPCRQSSVTTDGHTRQLRHNFVSADYFRLLGLAVEGRGFTVSEAESRAKSAVISRATAASLWPGTSPAGRTFSLKQGDGAVPVSYEVVGVVPDVVNSFLFAGKDPSAIYLPAAAGSPGIGSAIVRIGGNTRETVEAIRRACTRAEGCDPISLSELSALQRLPFRIAGAVSGVLAGLALLLTAAGLHSVASYSVIQRRREIGVHLALGASPAWVVRRVLGEALRCVAWGFALGLPVCLALSRIASSNVLQIRTFDPAAYVAVPLILGASTALACALPARRAASVDPATALRQE